MKLLPTGSTLSLDSQVRNYLREQLTARYSLAPFAGFLGYEVAPHHLRTARYIDAHRGDWSLILEPRGFGKSTIGTTTQTLRNLAVNPNSVNAIISNTHTQGVSFLREVKGHLDMNPELLAVFPELTPMRQRKKSWQRTAKYTQNQIDIAGKRSITKESSVFATGIFGPITGMHFDNIVLDDIIDWETATSERIREKVRIWFWQTLVPTLNPGGTLTIIGTRYHWDDLYGTLIGTETRPGQCYEKYIREKALVQADDGTLRTLWDKHQYNGRWLGQSLEELLALRENMGTALFNAQYQNDVTAMQGKVFELAWLEPVPMVGQPVHFTIGVDLAIGQREQNDYTAIVVCARTREGGLWVVYAHRGRYTFEQQIQAIIRTYEWVNQVYGMYPSVIGVEAVGYQASLPRILKEKTGMPIKEIQQRRDKVLRAMSTMQGPYETGVLRNLLGAHGMDEFVDEMAVFDEGAHDDLVDAAQIAVAEANNYTRGPVHIIGDALTG